jgi:hypothetical protein
MLVVALTEHAHRQTNQRTMGLWLLASLPALILVLSFIGFLLSSVFSCSGYASPCAFPKRRLTNDAVVVAGELSCLDFGLELHTILLWSGRLKLSGHDFSSRDRYMPQEG